MSKRRADQEAGYVLHTYPYKETSLIVELFTRHCGRVALLARGARRPRSAMRGMLLSFHPLRVSFSGSAELGNLHSVEWAGALQPLAGQGLMCGFYLNELLLRLVPREDPHETLFEAYGHALEKLSILPDASAVLRGFEKRLLAELGYAPVLEHDAASCPIDPERLYAYEPERGPTAVNGAVNSTRGAALVVRGRTLLDLAADDYSDPASRDEARKLMRVLIGERLHGQVLHTRTVLRELSDL